MRIQYVYRDLQRKKVHRKFKYGFIVKNFLFSKASIQNVYERQTDRKTIRLRVKMMEYLLLFEKGLETVMNNFSGLFLAVCGEFYAN